MTDSPLVVSGADGIALAAAALRAGGLVAIPTETVYGLGADASNPDAVAAIFRVKGRPTNHPLIVHIADAAAVGEWAVAVSDEARALADAGYIVGALQRVLFQAPGVKETNWSATAPVRGVDGDVVGQQQVRLLGREQVPVEVARGRPRDDLGRPDGPRVARRGIVGVRVTGDEEPPDEHRVTVPAGRATPSLKALS